MLVGSVEVSVWLVWGVLALAATGLWAVLWQCDHLGRWIWERLHNRGYRIEDDPDEEFPPGEGNHFYEEGTPAGPLDPLPPERTWEQMTSHQLPVVQIAPIARGPGDDGPQTWAWQYAGAERERRAPWWEAEHRAAYESLGFDYPSGLMARMRELGP